MGYQGGLNKYNKDREKVLATVVTNFLDTDTEFDLQNLFNKTITVYNQGPGALGAGVVEVSPDANALHWATLIAIAGGTLGSATVWNHQVTNDTYKYWRVRGAAVSGSVATVNTYFRF